jgi:hypothetical protein
MTANNNKFRELSRQGFSHREICEMLNIDMDAATLAQMASSQEVVRLDSLRQDFLPKAFQILQEIAETGERDADRINACKLIIAGEGIMPDIGTNAFDERIKKMKAAMGEVIEVEFSQDREVITNNRAMVLAS